MATRTQYLKRRGNRWYFQIAVPLALQPLLKKKTIEESLKTADLKVAQTHAFERAAHWRRQFKIDSGSARALPREVFHRTLEETRQRIAWIERSFHDDNDRDFHLDQLQANWLDPELARLGYLDHSEIREGDLAPDVVAALDAVSLARSGGGATPPEYLAPFSELAADFISDRQRDPSERLTAQTIGQMEATYRLFRDHIADAALSTVTPKVAAEFVAKAGQLERNWGRSPETKSRSFTELLALSASSKGSRLSNRTLKRYCSALTQLWDWARVRGDVDGGTPFVAPQVRKSKRGGGKVSNAPWPDDALKAYFHGTPDRSQPGRPDPFYWLPRIALLSGMRINEICSLEATDLKTAEGVAYFDIPLGKTESSVRVVPIHSALQPFLQIAPTSGFLFPDLVPGGPEAKRSWNISKSFGRRTTLMKIDGRSTFHAFRKNVAEALERARVPETEASQLVGHKRAGMTYGVYSPNGLTIRQKSELIEKLAIPT